MQNNIKGFTFLELLLTASLSSVITLSLIKVALAFMLELKHQQQQMETLAEASLLAKQLRTVLQNTQCHPLVQSPNKLTACHVSYYYHNDKIYRKSQLSRAERLADNVKQFKVTKVKQKIKIEIILHKLKFEIIG